MIGFYDLRKMGKFLDRDDEGEEMAICAELFVLNLHVVNSLNLILFDYTVEKSNTHVFKLRLKFSDKQFLD